MFVKPLKIELSENKKDSKGRIQILRAGDFDHDWYGKMSFDEDVFENMIKNFENNVRGIEIAVNYSHFAGGEAAGWIEKLEIVDGGLYADVRWTKEAKEKIEDERFKYISAEFENDYKDNESGKHFGVTLLGAALTNIPFVKNMDRVLSELKDLPEEAHEKLKAFVLSKTEKETKTMKFDELLEALKSLSEDEKSKVIEAIGVKTLSEGNKDGDKQLQEENKKLKTELEDKNKEIQFSEMLREGKVVPGQKEAFMKGDMKAFAEGAVDINLKAKGTGKQELSDDKSGKSEEQDEMTADQASDKILELAEEMAEKKKMNLSDAISRVRHDNPDLVKIIAQ